MKNIMIVDDDDLFIFLTKKIIKETGFFNLKHVFNYSSDALEFLAKNASTEDELPDILLLDLSMPVMDGWEFLDEYYNIKAAIKKSIDVYICSSSISPDDIIQAKKLDFVRDYIIKPLSFEKMQELIKQS